MPLSNFCIYVSEWTKQLNIDNSNVAQESSYMGSMVVLTLLHGDIWVELQSHLVTVISHLFHTNFIHKNSCLWNKNWKTVLLNGDHLKFPWQNFLHDIHSIRSSRPTCFLEVTQLHLSSIDVHMQHLFQFRSQHFAKSCCHVLLGPLCTSQPPSDVVLSILFFNLHRYSFVAF